MERWLFEFTIRELDLCRDWTLMLGRKSSYERVASLILMIARRARFTASARLQENHAQFELPLSRSELADYLGLTERILATLRLHRGTPPLWPKPLSQKNFR